MRYRATDMPARLADEIVMHPTAAHHWLSVRGTDPPGQSLMFDIREDGDGRASIRAFI